MPTTGMLLLGTELRGLYDAHFSVSATIEAETSKSASRPLVVFSTGSHIVPLKAGQFLGDGLTMGVYSEGLRGAVVSARARIVPGPTEKHTSFTVRIPGRGTIHVTAVPPFWRPQPRKGNAYALGPIITAQMVKQQAELYLKFPLSEETVLEGLAYFLNQISDLAYVYELAQGVVNCADRWYHLPRTLTYLEEVRDSQNCLYGHFRVIDGMIAFAKPDTYTILYRRMPRPPIRLRDRLEVHSTYFSALVKGIIGWAKLKDDDLSPDGLRLVAEFREEAMKSFNILRRGRKTVQTVRVIR